MKAVLVVLAFCGLSSVSAAPVARVGLLGLSLGRQGLASAGIGIGSMATNLATGLASNTLGALSGVPILGPLAQIGQAAVETGNNFAQMGMGIGQMAVNGFGGRSGAAQQQFAAQQQLAAQQLSGIQQLAAQQLAGQVAAQQQQAAQQLAAQLQAQQQLASQVAAQQQMSQAAQQQGVRQDGSVQQQTSNFRQIESFQDILGSPELDSWWNPSPPQPVYIGS